MVLTGLNSSLRFSLRRIQHQAVQRDILLSFLNFGRHPTTPVQLLDHRSDQIEDRSSVNIFAATQRSFSEGTGQHETSSRQDEVNH